MIKLSTLIFSLFYVASVTTQDLCEECRLAAGSTPVDRLAGQVQAIQNQTSCSTGSTYRLFEGVDDPRCNGFGIMTHSMGGSPPRFDEHLNYSGRGEDFYMGFSRVADKIEETTRTTPADQFRIFGYVSSNAGGCARTEGSLRQVRRNFCFTFAREMEAKTNALINQMFNNKGLDRASDLLNSSTSYEAMLNAWLTIFDHDANYPTQLEQAYIRSREMSVSATLPASERELLGQEFRGKLRTYVTNWATNARNSLAALRRAQSLARTAGLRGEATGGSMGGCENIMGQLYHAWPDLFSFSTGGRNNKASDYAYCTARQAGVDDSHDRARERVSKNMMMGLGFVASLAAAPLTGGSSLAIAAGVIAGTASATTGMMSIAEGVRREGLIPLQMQTREISVNLAGNTPEANREMQQHYRTLRRDINILYGTGAIEMIIGVFEAGGGGAMLADKLATLGSHGAHHATLEAAKSLFKNLGDRTIAREVMYDVILSAGLRFGPGQVEHALLSDHGGGGGH